MDCKPTAIDPPTNLDDHSTRPAASDHPSTIEVQADAHVKAEIDWWRAACEGETSAYERAAVEAMGGAS